MEGGATAAAAEGGGVVVGALDTTVADMEGAADTVVEGKVRHVDSLLCAVENEADQIALRQEGMGAGLTGVIVGEGETGAWPLFTALYCGV